MNCFNLKFINLSGCVVSLLLCFSLHLLYVNNYDGNDKNHDEQTIFVLKLFQKTNI